jgi:hypothetical protein
MMCVSRISRPCTSILLVLLNIFNYPAAKLKDQAAAGANFAADILKEFNYFWKLRSKHPGFSVLN